MRVGAVGNYDKKLRSTSHVALKPRNKQAKNTHTAETEAILTTKLHITSDSWSSQKCNKICEVFLYGTHHDQKTNEHQCEIPRRCQIMHAKWKNCANMSDRGYCRRLLSSYMKSNNWITNSDKKIDRLIQMVVWSYDYNRPSYIR